MLKINMKVIYKTLPSVRHRCIATIGTFDGLHHGHEYIIDKVKRTSRIKKMRSLVITFDKLPQQFLNNYHLKNRWQSRKPFSGCISDNTSKTFLMERTGVDYLWLLKTNRKLLELSGESFIAYICKYFDIKTFVVGEDFRFGYAGRENIDSLKKLSSQWGFSVEVIKKRSKSKRIISSSLIRELIATGRLEKVEEFLGRKYAVSAKVSKGKGIGRKQGFPTANIIVRDYVAPLGGVYASYIVLGKKVYLGAVFVDEPSLKKHETLVEAHIIGLDKNILNKRMTVIFIKKIRKRRKFATSALLRQAIKKDIRQISSKYSTPPPNHTQPLVV
jgi:riboflavin kinase / FMN adenylyltransferase